MTLMVDNVLVIINGEILAVLQWITSIYLLFYLLMLYSTIAEGHLVLQFV